MDAQLVPEIRISTGPDSPVVSSPSPDVTSDGEDGRHVSGSFDETFAREAGYEVLDSTEPGATAGEARSASPVSPHPPPPSPITTPPVETVEYSPDLNLFADKMSEDVSGDSERDWGILGMSNNDYSKSSVDDPAPPASSGGAAPDTAGAWMDYEDAHRTAFDEDLGELKLDLDPSYDNDDDDDKDDDDKQEEEEVEESSPGETKSPPSRPSAPPARPAAPPSQKPQRPPPPRPAAGPKKNWETFEGGTSPARPPPPKMPAKSPVTDEAGSAEKKKSKIIINTKNIKGLGDKKKKKNKDKAREEDDLAAASEQPVSKDSDQWKEFEAMQQRITSAMKHTQEKVSELETGFESEIKKLDETSAQSSPWAALTPDPPTNNTPAAPDTADNLMDDKKTTWVGFDDDFSASDVNKFAAKSSAEVPDQTDVAPVSQPEVDLLGLSSGGDAVADATDAGVTAPSESPALYSDLLGLCGEAEAAEEVAPPDNVGGGTVALDIVDEFLGEEAKKQPEEFVIDPLKKLELMKGGGATEGAVEEDEDPFGLGMSQSAAAPVREAGGDLFIVEDHEKCLDLSALDDTTETTQPAADMCSPLSDDFDPRADICLEKLNVKPATDEVSSPEKKSSVVDKAISRPRPKGVAAASNPFNLMLAVHDEPAAPEPSSLLGEDFTQPDTETDLIGEFAPLSASNPFAQALIEDAANTEATDAAAASFNPFATITDDTAHHTDENFDPFQTIHDDDAFDLHLSTTTTEEATGQSEDASSPNRFNPFDKEPPLDEKFAKFESKTKSEEEKPDSSAASTEGSLDEEPDELPPFYPPFDGEGWNLLLRQPIKKKLTQNRFWKPVFVRLKTVNNIPTVLVYNDEKETKAIHELPLQPAYQLCNMGLQQYDQFGKCHTIKLQYVFYKERVGVKAERITPTLSDLTRVRNFKGLKDLVHKPKTTMILDHSPQNSELLKFGSLNYDEIRTFTREIEDALFHLKSSRENKALQYTKDEITVDLVDEYYAEIDSEGHITFHKGRVRMFCLAFLSGQMPWVEVGVNDKRRQGKEVVGRKDIVPIKTEEWIRMQDSEFHSTIDLEEIEKTKIVKFVPLDACQYEIMRFRTRPRLNKELPLQIRCQMSVVNKHVEIRGDVMIPGYYSNSRRANQTPCEDIQIRFPIPEQWFYYFRTEKRFRYGAVHSHTRKPGKIKGLERLTMMAQGMMPPSLIEVSKGMAKFENVHRAIVWKIPKLPERNEEAYKTHLFVLKMDLGPHDEMPESYEEFITVEYNMPNSTVSRAQIRSIGIDCDEPPDRWVHHLAKYEYKVGIEFCDRPKAPNTTEVVMVPVYPSDKPADGEEAVAPRAEEEEDVDDDDDDDDSSTSSDSSDSD